MKAKKSLGQNFLLDRNITRRIVDSVAPTQSDIIIEIGPGKGALTGLLLEQSGLVVAIELDTRLIDQLRQTFHRPNFILLEADALAVNWQELIDSSIYQWQQLNPQLEQQPQVRIVANLPYYVATPIVEKLLRLKEPLTDMTLMLQEEVADRMTSEPGNKRYGYLSLLVQYFAATEKMFIVPPEAFFPVPKIYSAVVHLQIRPLPGIQVGDEERFFTLLRAAFAQRRKTIANNLKAALSYLRPVRTVDESLQQAKIAATRRAETLSLEEFAVLYSKLFES